MDEDIKIAIAVIKVQLENMSDQMKRFISHVESERDVRVEQGKRIDHIQKSVEIMQVLKESSSASSKWRLETIISIVLLISNLAMVAAMLFK